MRIGRVVRQGLMNPLNQAQRRRGVMSTVTEQLPLFSGIRLSISLILFFLTIVFQVCAYWTSILTGFNACSSSFHFLKQIMITNQTQRRRVVMSTVMSQTILFFISSHYYEKICI